MVNQFNKIFTRINEIGRGFQLLNEVQGCVILIHGSKIRFQLIFQGAPKLYH